MGYYSEIWIHFDMKNIKSKEELFDILSIEEKKYLDEWYDDLNIEDGYFVLSDYFRKNYESEHWLGILQKIAKIENEGKEIKFIGEDGESWGYRAYPDGKVEELTQEWVVVDD